MNAPLEAIAASVQTNNTAIYIREAFVSLGVDAANIKSVYPSTGGFAAHRNRWCVTLYHSVRLSAVQVNAVDGFSGATVNGNVWFILVGKGE